MLKNKFKYTEHRQDHKKRNIICDPLQNYKDVAKAGYDRETTTDSRRWSVAAFLAHLLGLTAAKCSAEKKHNKTKKVKNKNKAHTSKPNMAHINTAHTYIYIY